MYFSLPLENCGNVKEKRLHTLHLITRMRNTVQALGSCPWVRKWKSETSLNHALWSLAGVFGGILHLELWGKSCSSTVVCSETLPNDSSVSFWLYSSGLEKVPSSPCFQQDNINSKINTLPKLLLHVSSQENCVCHVYFSVGNKEKYVRCKREKKIIKRYFNTLSRGRVYLCPVGNGIKAVPAGMIYNRKHSFCRMKTFLGKNPLFFLTIFFFIWKTQFLKGGGWLK